MFIYMVGWYNSMVPNFLLLLLFLGLKFTLGVGEEEGKKVNCKWERLEEHKGYSGEKELQWHMLHHCGCAWVIMSLRVCSCTLHDLTHHTGDPDLFSLLFSDLYASVIMAVYQIKSMYKYFMAPKWYTYLPEKTKNLVCSC